MISRPAIVLLILSIGASLAAAGEIREFSVPTLERLGNELTRASQSPDRGASDAARKRARETAAAALRGKLFDTRYDYVVLSDPDGKRLLVYALAAAKYTDQLVLAGHFRVTISADGTKPSVSTLFQRALLTAAQWRRMPWHYG
jgi:phosphomannomutase